MEVKEIVRQWLKARDCQGLQSTLTDCRCDMDELMYCVGDCADCVPRFQTGQPGMDILAGEVRHDG